MFDSELAFEDNLSGRLAALHAFALFLACDREDRAEALLARAVSRAFAAHRRGDDPAQALERGLLEEVTRSWSGLKTRVSMIPATITEADRARLASMSPARLRRAAAAIPPIARAAIWLVVVERRGYAEAATLLGTDEPTLSALLAWRDPLIRYALDDPAADALRIAGRGR